MYELGILLILLAVGYIFGRIAEQRHYRSIIRRETAFQRIPVFATRHLPDDLEPGVRTNLVMGSVVISVDYFKRFLAGLRMLVGGRMNSYESLIDRARREAVLRLQDEARHKGGNMVFNIKFETASISKGAKNTVGSIEVLAYGTVVIPPHRLTAE
ncbi:MAG: heavy metal-binding domain-containing protein [Thiogranum sp.]